MERSRIHRRVQLALAGMGACLLAQCAAPDYTRLAEAEPAAAVHNETFEYRTWVHSGEPETVLVGIHGFCGAAIDFDNLGQYMMRHHPEVAVYAYEIRGQGMDPLEQRRGDIDNPDYWSSDLTTFTAMLRERHPRARIVWFGESMGALIASRTVAESVRGGGRPACDALALSSPIVKFPDDFPTWKKDLVLTASRIAPGARVGIGSLHDDEVQMTETSTHGNQSQTNPWHVERHTLRMLGSLANLIDEMPDNARCFPVPTLVLHGGRDFFSRPEDVKAFTGCVPVRSGRTRRYYPDAHHLMMYDEDREKLFRDVASWLRRIE